MALVLDLDDPGARRRLARIAELPDVPSKEDLAGMVEAVVAVNGVILGPLESLEDAVTRATGPEVEVPGARILSRERGSTGEIILRVEAPVESTFTVFLLKPAGAGGLPPSWRKAADVRRLPAARPETTARGAVHALTLPPNAAEETLSSLVVVSLERVIAFFELAALERA